MQVVQTTSSLENEFAGTTYVVRRLAESIAITGHGVELFSLGEQRQPHDSTYHDIRFKRHLTRYGPLGRLGVSDRMRRALITSRADVFHTHGLWMMPNIYPADAARRLARPFILSPHGMFGKEALQFSKFKKRFFWALLQGRAVHRVTCFHATAMQEYEDIRSFGLKQPVAIIPNGIDLPILPISTPREEAITPFVLSLGRIHAIKGLDRLIRGWALVSTDFPQWRLKIVGPSENGHAEELKRLVRELKLDSVEILGPVFGNEKMALLAEAEVFALSTLQENFGMTVAESLAVETPVISTKGAPWQGLADGHCGWWIEHGHNHMALALKEAMSLTSAERRIMGARGRAWMKRDFGWDAVAQKMLEVYFWTLGQRSKPDCVIVG